MSATTVSPLMGRVFYYVNIKGALCSFGEEILIRRPKQTEKNRLHLFSWPNKLNKQNDLEDNTVSCRFTLFICDVILLSYGKAEYFWVCI